MRPFHFLADVSQLVGGAELAARARRAEQLGYHSVVRPDHLLIRRIRKQYLDAWSYSAPLLPWLQQGLIGAIIKGPRLMGTYRLGPTVGLRGQKERVAR